MIGVRIFVGSMLAMGWIWVVGMVFMLAYDAHNKTQMYKARHDAVFINRYGARYGAVR